jgi:hypothetical protein
MCNCGGQCGHCASTGLGWLMGGLLPANSQVKTRLQIQVDAPLGITQSIADGLQNTIEGCVYATGGFSSVTVLIDWHYIYDVVWAVVAVTTVNDHADIEDVGAWIQGAIQACVPDVTVVSRDNTVGVGATDSAGNPLPQGNNPPVNNPQSPGTCNWATSKSVGDYLACQFGVSTGTAVTIGVIATLGVLFALGRR